MSSQGVATTLVYMAYNTSTGAYVTGDVANHTLKLVKDGTEASPTNSPAEVDATNTPGAYKLALTAAETNFGTVWLGGKSSTANVILIPITSTFEILPTALVGGGVSTGSNIKKNTAQNNFMFVMTLSSNNAPATGVVVGGFVYQDGGAQQSLTNSVTELSNGVYQVNLAAADTNCNHMLLRFTGANCNDRIIEIITVP